MLIKVKNISPFIGVFTINNLHGNFILLPKEVDASEVLSPEEALIYDVAFTLENNDYSMIRKYDYLDVYITAKMYCGSSSWKITSMYNGVLSNAKISEAMIELAERLTDTMDCTQLVSPEDVVTLMLECQKIFSPGNIGNIIYVFLRHCVNTEVFELKDPSKLLAERWLKILSYASYTYGVEDSDNIWAILWYTYLGVNISAAKVPLEIDIIPGPKTLDVIFAALDIIAHEN